MDSDKLPGARRQCRRCGIRLTTKNARTYDGRWVGACRECENAETRERQAKEVWTCPTLGTASGCPRQRPEPGPN
jgi:hypothetical protein